MEERIRLIEKADNEAVRQIIKESLKEYGLNIPGTAYFDPQLDDLYSFYNQPYHGVYWIMECGGAVAGGTGIGPFRGDQEIAELQKFYIAKEYRGNGFGKKLLKQAVEYAGLHYKMLYIETSDLLVRANSIYVQSGFRQLGKPLNGTEHPAVNCWYLLEF